MIKQLIYLQYCSWVINEGLLLVAPGCFWWSHSTNWFLLLSWSVRSSILFRCNVLTSSLLIIIIITIIILWWHIFFLGFKSHLIQFQKTLGELVPAKWWMNFPNHDLPYNWSSPVKNNDVNYFTLRLLHFFCRNSRSPIHSRNIFS